MDKLFFLALFVSFVVAQNCEQTSSQAYKDCLKNDIRRVHKCQKHRQNAFTICKNTEHNKSINMP